MKLKTMKLNTDFLAGFAALVVSSGLHMAYAGSPVHEVVGSTESAVCTVVKRVTIDASKPLTTTNPIEGISTLPTVCNSRIFSKSEYVDGIRSLLVIGWRITSASHQVTTLGPNASTGAVELLISAVFSLERPSATANGR